MEIGAILKESREKQNISLDRLQDTTKIQKRYLKAIEQNNFHILPGTFYARAFIKEYAEAVGLNADELLEAHQNELPTSQAKSDVQYTRMQRSRKDGQPNKNSVLLSILPKVIVVLLIIGVIFLAITLYKKAMEESNDKPVDNNDGEIIRDKDPTDIEPPNGTPDKVENNGALDGETEENDDNNDQNQQPEQKLTKIKEGTGSKPESTFELENAGDDIMLKFEPTGESWLDVINEKNDYLFQGITEAGTPIEVDVSGEKKFRMNIGSADHLPNIYINDIKFEYPVDSNKFITQRIWFDVINTDSE